MLRSVLIMAVLTVGCFAEDAGSPLNLKTCHRAFQVRFNRLCPNGLGWVIDPANPMDWQRATTTESTIVGAADVMQPPWHKRSREDPQGRNGCRTPHECCCVQSCSDEEFASFCPMTGTPPRNIH